MCCMWMCIHLNIKDQLAKANWSFKVPSTTTYQLPLVEGLRWDQTWTIWRFGREESEFQTGEAILISQGHVRFFFVDWSGLAPIESLFQRKNARNKPCSGKKSLRIRIRPAHIGKVRQGNFIYRPLFIHEADWNYIVYTLSKITIQFFSGRVQYIFKHLELITMTSYVGVKMHIKSQAGSKTHKSNSRLTSKVWRHTSSDL